jgi:NADH-quinone oxidoreductase subunit J
MIASLVFYMFAALAIGGGLMVISARNPVHSVLWLIFVFFNAAGLFLLLGAEFLAMVLVVVYVGAVAVLFLFVVMMLDINFLRLREGFLQYLPTGAMIGLVLLAELISLFAGWAFAPEGQRVLAAPMNPAVSNTEALGRILYTDYFYLFQAAGMVLLVAMVGTILLTLRTRSGVRKQDIGRQVARRPADTLEIKKVPSGGGI